MNFKEKTEIYLKGIVRPKMVLSPSCHYDILSSVEDKKKRFFNNVLTTMTFIVEWSPMLFDLSVLQISSFVFCRRKKSHKGLEHF